MVMEQDKFPKYFWSNYEVGSFYFFLEKQLDILEYYRALKYNLKN